MQTGFLLSFVTIARLGSFSAAAEALYVSQPALSQQMRALEKELGFALFTRSKREGLRLTPEGEAFRETAEGVLRELNEAAEKCRQTARARPLVIGCDEYDIKILHFGFFDAVHRALPGVELRLVPVEEERYDKLLFENAVDIVLCSDCFPADSRALRFLELKRLGYLCVMSPGHPLSDKNALCPADLSGQRVSFCVPGVSQSYDAMRQRLLREQPGMAEVAPYERIYSYSVIDHETIFVTVDSARLFLSDLCCIPLQTEGTVPIGFLCRSDCDDRVARVMRVAGGLRF